MRVVRTLAIAVIALYCILSAAFTFTRWDMQGWYGWNVGPDGNTVIWVTPGYPVAKAGIKAGDRVDWATMPLAVRANAVLNQPAQLQWPQQIVVRRDHTVRTVTLQAAKAPPGFQVSSDIAMLATCIVIAIAAGLVLLRPSRMTWGFLIAMLIGAYPAIWGWGQQSVSAFLIVNGGYAALLGLQTAGLLMFASRFPGDVARGPLRWVDRAAVPAGMLATALWLYVDFTILLSTSTPPLHAILVVNEFVTPIVVSAVVLASLLTACVLGKGSDRQRMIPVVTAFCVVVALNTSNVIYFTLYTVGPVQAFLNTLIALAMVWLAVSVAHGVIKNRVIDVSFVISRTLVYTILTSLVVAAFVMVDFISSKLLEHFQITILLEAGVALAYGVWLNALHSRIDRFIDSTFFRRRHEAEARLDRAANVLMHADTPEFVDEALVTEAVDAYELAGAAVFRRTGADVFERTASFGWDDSHVKTLTGQDRIIVQLRAELQPLDLSNIQKPRVPVPMGVKQPLLALPFVVRHELLGFVGYSGHRGGEALDPEEIRVLRRFADAAAVAYDHLVSEALRRRIDAVEQENAQLRHGEQLVRDMLDALRRTPRSVEG